MSTGPVWCKSSYSGAEGGNCVEVAIFWRRSSHSPDSGGNCVEVAVATHPDTVHVRDSKDTTLRAISATPAAWVAFISRAASDT